MADDLDLVALQAPPCATELLARRADDEDDPLRAALRAAFHVEALIDPEADEP
jgi:hypothetical protein